MLVKILGAIDLIAGSILIFGSGINLPLLFSLFGIVLIIKSFMGFLKDFASWVDLIAGSILLISIILPIPITIKIIIGLLVLQKGIVSFL